MKPWEAIGMSRGSWYRHGKPTTRPEKYTQKRWAEVFGMSVRSIQRYRTAEKREVRDAFEKALEEGGFNGPWDDLDAKVAWAERHPDLWAAIKGEAYKNMADKIMRSSRVRDFIKLVTFVMEHPEFEAWILLTEDGAPLEVRPLPPHAAAILGITAASQEAATMAESRDGDQQDSAANGKGASQNADTMAES